jgi:parvulin-like peptidyl-prolyl isomerase
MKGSRTILFFIFLFTCHNLSAQVDSSLVKIKEVQKKLLAGEDFCELVKKYSQDNASVYKCGEIGTFKTGENLVKEYEEAMVSLKVGETSGIVKSPYGYHLIQLLAKSNDGYRSRHIMIRKYMKENK